MNRRLIRSMLDKAASQFDAKGHRDLADKVDLYAEKLAKTDNEREVALIARQLKRINVEAKKRDGGGRPGRGRVRSVARRTSSTGGLTIRRLERRIALLERKLARADKPTTSNRRRAREARINRIRRSRR